MAKRQTKLTDFGFVSFRPLQEEQRASGGVEERAVGGIEDGAQTVVDVGQGRAPGEEGGVVKEADDAIKALRISNPESAPQLPGAKGSWSESRGTWLYDLRVPEFWEKAEGELPNRPTLTDIMRHDFQSQLSGLFQRGFTTIPLCDPMAMGDWGDKAWHAALSCLEKIIDAEDNAVNAEHRILNQHIRLLMFRSSSSVLELLGDLGINEFLFDAELYDIENTRRLLQAKTTVDGRLLFRPRISGDTLDDECTDEECAVAISTSAYNPLCKAQMWLKQRGVIRDRRQWALELPSWRVDYEQRVQDDRRKLQANLRANLRAKAAQNV